MILGISSPASQNSSEELKKGLEFLKSKGISYVVGKSCYEYISPEERASELYELADVADAILCTRGGCGSFRLLDYMDRPLKVPIIGYSDITSLLLFQRLHNSQAIHAPMLLDYQKHSSLDNLFRIMENGVESGDIFLGKMKSFCLYPGTAEGECVPANLSLMMTVKDRIGHEKLFKNSILLLEDVTESVCSIERYLWQLRGIPEFEKVNGIIFGGFTRIEKSSNPYNLMDVLRVFANEFKKPCFIGFPIFHGKYYKTSIPMGLKVMMNSENGMLISRESSKFKIRS